MRDDSLAALGLDPDEESVYALLSRSLPQSTRALSEQLPGIAVGDVLIRLLAQGLVVEQTTQAHTRYAAIAPDAALAPLLHARDTELREARRWVDEVIAAHRPPIRTRAGLAEQISGPSAVAERAQELSAHARRSFRYVERGPSLLRHEHDATLSFRAVLAGGPPTDLAPDHHDCVRTLPEVSTRMYLSDDDAGLIVAPDGESALEVGGSAILTALSLLFDELWRRAGPHVDEDALLAALAAGMTDEAIARQLEVSDRTAQRHLAALLESMGAKTRFQAGVQAALRLRRGRGGSAGYGDPDRPA